MEAVKDEESLEAGAVANVGSDTDSWDNVEEDDDEIELKIVCLFCPRIFKTMAITLTHCKVEHNFDLVDLKAKFNMDCYSYIRMINFVRREGVSPEALYSPDVTWYKDIYLTPVIQDDPWLMFDIEGLEVPLTCEDDNRSVMNKIVKLTSEDIEKSGLAQATIKYYEDSLRYYASEAQKKDAMIASAYDQIQEMKDIANRLFSGDIAREYREVENKLLTMNLSEDNGYFKTYSHYGIHLEMLSDQVRMLSYREALYMNRSLIRDKIVLDVGCGSGILSLFAATAEAAKVYGVDQSDIIYHANDIIRENDMSSVIHLIHGKIEDVVLPVEKVDIIVSEWLGYFLLFEGMLDCVLYARDNFLKPDGRILPDYCSLHIVGVADADSYERMVRFWNDVYGFKMPSLAKEVLREAAVIEVGSEMIATTSAKIFEINLYVHDVKHTNFKTKFVLESLIDGELNALCGYFDVDFNLPHKVSFSTSPKHAKTHWKQTVFFLPNPIPLSKGATLQGQIECKRKPEDIRSLVITISIEDQKNVYVLA